MSESKSNPSRQGKAQAYSQKQQALAHKRAQAPRTQIVPSTKWESTDMLAIRGDLLETFNKTFEILYHGFQQLGQIYQQIIALNVKGEANPEGKIIFDYIWDNGEPVSDVDKKVFVQKMGQIQALRQKQAQEVEQLAQVKDAFKEESGLVTVDGAPLTEERLEQDHKIIK